MNRNWFRGSAIALGGAVTIFLAGCAGSEGPDPGPGTVVMSPQPETVAEQSVEREPAPAPVADHGGEGRGSAPCEVSGYSPEGERERHEEGFSEQQVSEAVARGCGTAGWDDDGHWEIDLDWIEVDIRPDGTVIEVDD